MKRCLYLVLFQIMLTTAALFGQKLSLNAIRTDFKIGHEDETICMKHLKTLEEHALSPVERGYEAAYHMFMANHTGNPFKKLGYFKNGKKMLEEEIAKNPREIELRYIRLCIQYYSPAFLGYKDNIEEDKGFLVNNLYKLKDPETKQLIYTYLKGAKMYSDAELALLCR